MASSSDESSEEADVENSKSGETIEGNPSPSCSEYESPFSFSPISEIETSSSSISEAEMFELLERGMLRILLEVEIEVAKQSDRRLGRGNFKIPAATYNVQGRGIEQLVG
ncbi:Major facilitator superfamily protein [Perilla frutescens var. frutescens]|nr:Major facilitator superfamily protein [Perilla frutescens var. frutescens]